MLGLLLCLLAAPSTMAGVIYQVTSTADGQTVEYNVSFGGSSVTAQYTAFDPASGEFVYIYFPRDGTPPQPAATIWDHTTGQTIDLYDFPGVEQPLPVIPSIEDMAVCPKTGDPDFRFIIVAHRD